MVSAAALHTGRTTERTNEPRTSEADEHLHSEPKNRTVDRLHYYRTGQTITEPAKQTHRKQPNRRRIVKKIVDKCNFSLDNIFDGADFER